MKKVVALYPYNEEMFSYIKHFSKLQSEYTDIIPFSPSGFGVIGKDAAYILNRENIGIKIVDIADIDCKSWDVLLLLQTSKTAGLISTHEIAKIALESGKKVYYFLNDTTDIDSEILALKNAYPNNLFYYGIRLSKTEGRFYYSARFRKVRTPVILIGGLLGESDSSEVLLALTNKMRNDGMRPMVIGKNSICEFFGFHSLNYIFEQTEKLEVEKIMEINSYVYTHEKNELPDVILIEAPDAVMRFDDIVSNGFGIRTYMLCQAVQPDYFICCVPVDLAISDFIENISVDFSHRLGIPINAVHVSNIAFDLSMLDMQEVSYVRVNKEYVKDHINEEKEHSKIFLFESDSNGIENIYEHLTI